MRRKQNVRSTCIKKVHEEKGKNNCTKTERERRENPTVLGKMWETGSETKETNSVCDERKTMG